MSLFHIYRSFYYRGGQGYSEVMSDSFSGAVIDTDKWTLTNPNSANITIAQSDGLTLTDPAGGSATTLWADRMESDDYLLSGYIQATISFSLLAASTPNSGMALFVDSNNFAVIQTRATGNLVWRLRIVQGGVSQYDNLTTGIDIATYPEVRIQSDDDNNISFWYKNGSVWTQMGTTQQVDIGFKKKLVLYSVGTTTGSQHVMSVSSASMVDTTASDYLVGWTGQSNMLARDKDNYENYGNVTNATIWNGSSFVALNIDALGVGTGQQSDVGPVLEFAKQMNIKYPNKRIRIVSVAQGGIGLHPDSSSPDWVSGTNGSLYDDFVSKYNTAKATLSSPFEVGVCWGQGERDATNSTYADAYEANEQAFISALESDIGLRRLAVMKIHDRLPIGTYPAAATVRTAKDNNNAAGHYFGMIDTDNTTDYPLIADSVHFSAAGSANLGAAFAELF